MSLNPYAREKIDGWVGDFCDSTRHARLPYPAKEYAPQVLVTLMVEACERGGVQPEEVAEADLRSALIEGVARLALPESVKPAVPGLCRAFLEELEDQGRLSGGAQLGRYVGALHVVYGDAASDRPRPIENVTTKLGRNDPCPCGSGKKYKKCCMRPLGMDPSGDSQESDTAP